MSTIDLIQKRIDACDTLIDCVHDDLPHAQQQPLLDKLIMLKWDLKTQLSQQQRLTDPVKVCDSL